MSSSCASCSPFFTDEDNCSCAFTSAFLSDKHSMLKQFSVQKHFLTTANLLEEL